ncbi:MFS transporter [Pseudomonas sp. 5P_3.1_Bac2]|uniref:MFS transporter n=1 Tax=Pseudomonas sp. 5P_3.1_Bac2 TaxID=2971617 RepID=UPI0021C8BBBE|nr:MFS transporter [Pseudomonas sp. 5P_3.1_Bac2]MCU1716228.1 MFS transporter [Pseudomonas sp. 5P_3.1_Bac2]
MLRANWTPVYLIALGAFALGMASYVTAGLLPLIVRDFSVSLALAAQLVTAFTLAYGLGSPLIVAVLPVQRQREGLLMALLVFVLANLASALAPTFAWLLFTRAVAGVAAGVYLAMGMAAAAGLCRSHQQGKAIALIMGGMASGTVIGVPLSLLLAQHLGWAAAIWLVAILGGLAWLGLAWRLPALAATQVLSLRSKLRLLGDVQVLSILLVSLLAAVASLGMYTFITPLLAEQGHGLLPVAVYLWVWGIGGVLGSFLIGSLVDRYPGSQLTLGILLLLGLSLLLLPLAAQFGAWLLMLPIAVWGAVGWALQVPQNQALLNARTQQGDGHVALALNESALYLGSAIGAALGGLHMLQGGSAWLLAVVAGAVALLGALVLWGGLFKRKRSSQVKP